MKVTEHIISLIKPEDPIFSLGLSYYEVMDLTKKQLSEFLVYTTREEIISWLQWNDPNGIYLDADSMLEFGNVLNREEGIEIMLRQILEA